MRAYDPDLPLIFIHVPKTAGTTVRQVFYDWFGDNLHYHYYDREADRLPEKVELREPVSGRWRPDICIYGHFNRDRGFGLEDYYPEVRQFVTILRDPFELMVSAYFYVNSRKSSWGEREWIRQAALEEFLDRSPASVFLPYFPAGLDRRNYREVLEERFVHLGITEDLEKSVDTMAHRLSRPPPGRIESLNRTPRPDDIDYERLRQRFSERHELDYLVYEFARALNTDTQG